MLAEGRQALRFRGFKVSCHGSPCAVSSYQSRQFMILMPCLLRPNKSGSLRTIAKRNDDDKTEMESHSDVTHPTSRDRLFASPISHLLDIKSSKMAGKKAAGENTKKAAGNAKKAEVAAQKAAIENQKKVAVEDEEWGKGAKSNAKK